MNKFQVKEYLKYQYQSGHWKGFGIHSPFMFEFVNLVMRESLPFYSYEKIEAWRTALLKSKVPINVGNWGAGSNLKSSKQKTVAQLVKKVALPTKYGQLLFRIVARYKPQNILELGTSLGMSTLYLSLPNSKAKVITIEGDPALADFAQHTFQEVGIKNIELLNGDFQEQLPVALDQFPTVDLVFFDGNHKKKPTLQYFYQCLEKVNNNTIFIFDDIYWSEEMHEAWKEIMSHPQVTVSVDLYRMGILFFRKESKKQHFTVRF